MMGTVTPTAMVPPVDNPEGDVLLLAPNKAGSVEVDDASAVVVVDEAMGGGAGGNVVVSMMVDCIGFVPLATMIDVRTTADKAAGGGGVELGIDAGVLIDAEGGTTAVVGIGVKVE